MRYLTQIFQPVITIPKNSKIKSTEITCISQKLLTECGLIRPTSTGMYALLPLAQRALQKLEALVRSSIEAAGGQRISLPTLTAASLWQRSGRLDSCQTELWQTTDRHNKKYILSPTHEEAVAELLADVAPLSYKQLPLLLYQTHEEAVAELLADVAPLSYKQLPLLLYQIGVKYRDEARPKHGLLRAREFRMLDAYGAHAGAAGARDVYARVARAYRQLFRRLQLAVHAVEAPCGDTGGSQSHEWHVLAPAGEDVVAACLPCRTAAPPGERACRSCHQPLTRCNSIEVGHTFVLGTKYSEALNSKFTTSDGRDEWVSMSCYGIGVSRLLAACVETASSERGLRWPAAIAPYSVLVIGPKEGSKEWSAGGYERALGLARGLSDRLAGDVLVDDRHALTIGKRLLHAQRTGYPTVVVCGAQATGEVPRFEVHFPDGENAFCSESELIARVSEPHHDSLDADSSVA